ncbi:MAG: response regulator transcription factor [Saprospiraceae bacterium]|nr:response regulator transcription factor [Saprospiraceae bacterium]
MITALIIEDEAPARKQLLRLLSAHSDFISVKGEAKTGHEAIALIASLKPDLLFLDIHLPDMNAFDVLTSLEGPSPYIIFTTAYDQYALKAFEVFSVEYLLKPLEESRFHAAIEKLKQLISRHQAFHMDVDHLKTMYAQQLLDKKIQALAVKQGQAITLLDFSKIAYMKAEDKYVFVYHLNGKKYLYDKALHILAEQLPAHFLRVHRSFIINTQQIKQITKDLRSRFVLHLNDEVSTRITCSNSFKDDIKKVLGVR